MLSSLSTIFLGLWLMVAGLFSFSAYWAFVTRRALQQGLYRRQALWVGWMAVYFVALTTVLSLLLTFEINILSINVLGGTLIATGFIVMFLWIDSTIRVARRSDPLSRDALRWSRLRYLWGIVTVGGAIGAVATAVNSGISTVAPFGGALFFGAVALLVSARRSGDPTLKKHLKWTGLCIFLLWLASQLAAPVSHIPFVADPTLGQSVPFVFVAVGAYCLYRSARSLVPLGHITHAEV